MPNPEKIAHGRTYFFQDVNELLLKTEDGLNIATWFLPNDSTENVIILLNGKGGNRKGLIKRAKFYHHKGFNVLLPDLRATGESEGHMITMGWHEQKDLKACYNHLIEKGFQNIAVHGLSLGAATIAYSLAENPQYQFIILESCYDNIDQALTNRLHTYYLPSFFLVGTKWLTEYRLGVSAAQLRPEDYLHLAKAPTLFLAGDSELKVKKAETEKLFQQCASEKKELHFFKGAIHEDFMNRYEKELKQVLSSWLSSFE